MGAVLGPQVTPLSKLYSMLKPAIAAGGVTVNGPHPGLTTGVVGVVGNITTFTILPWAHEPIPAAPAAVPPHTDDKI